MEAQRSGFRERDREMEEATLAMAVMMNRDK